tara:strand:- start:766 stop:993 length:228 start_codon:yes stop_codon:yes gene_type:complete
MLNNLVKTEPKIFLRYWFKAGRIRSNHAKSFCLVEDLWTQHLPGEFAICYGFDVNRYFDRNATFTPILDVLMITA